jgi:glucose/arabinose dehydrogenase
MTAMKQQLFLGAVFLCVVPVAAGQEPPKALVEGLNKPAGITVGHLDRKVYVSLGAGKGGGAVGVLDKDRVVPFAEGLTDPRGLASFQVWVFVVDRNALWRIDPKGKVDDFTPPNAFPSEPQSLGHLAVDQESGTLYVSDGGDAAGKGGAVYRVNGRGEPSLVLDAKRLPGLGRPGALVTDGASHLIVADAATGTLYRVKLADGSAEKIAEGMGSADGLAWDPFGRLYVTDRAGGRLVVIPRPADKPAVVAKGFPGAGAVGYDLAGARLLVADAKVGSLTAVAAGVPGAEIDERPLALDTAVAFPDLKWTDWKAETAGGKPNPLRPIVLTHAGDGSDRVFVATQHGVVHVFPNDQKATRTKVFLDIQDRVAYDDKTNEEGFLGLAFHPKYKTNGEFFVFYTPKKLKMTNVLARFRVSKDDPDRADPASEEELLRFTKPYWNHDGGTICFGPDGYLYVTHGDGGLANDPHDNGQNLGSLLGKVLRLDVDHKDEGKNYAIPKDNPFVGKEGAKPEIWAYGLRNIWRMSFDRKTGRLWAGDVGQNLWEEIDLIDRGGNYGWNRREGQHPFGARGKGPGKEFLEPIWEYHHDVGKCVIGGHVYRGSRLSELEGHYLYADFVTSKLWALRYDEDKGRVVENRPIKDRGRAFLSFGEDEKGEVYLLSVAADGKGIYWYVKQ